VVLTDRCDRALLRVAVHMLERWRGKLLALEEMEDLLGCLKGDMPGARLRRLRRLRRRLQRRWRRLRRRRRGAPAGLARALAAGGLAGQGRLCAGQLGAGPGRLALDSGLSSSSAGSGSSGGSSSWRFLPAPAPLRRAHAASPT
jgi:hypothetical protein